MQLPVIHEQFVMGVFHGTEQIADYLGGGTA